VLFSSASVAASAEYKRAWSARAAKTDATFVYTYREKPPHEGRRLVLTILRGGHRWFRETIPVHPRDRELQPAPGDRQPLAVRDLDGDREPEVLVDLGSNGRWGYWVRIYRLDWARHRFVPTNLWWGNLGASYRCLCDLDGDHRPEFVAADDRFGALSYWYDDPVQIWSYDQGRFRDITRRFPTVIKRDARRHWRFWNEEHLRETLAAWVADKYLLREKKEADRVLAQALRRGQLARWPLETYAPSGRQFVAHLRALLSSAGYA
jgi:hypothetical protein